MKLTGKSSKGMRIIAAIFAITVLLTSFRGISAWAEGIKNNEIKKEYTTDDISGSLLKLGKKAERTDENAYDITLSVKDKSFEHDKKMLLTNTDVVFVVDTSASMNEDEGWSNLIEVLGNGKREGLIYNILGNDNDKSNNSVTFVGYNGNKLSFSNPDYYISSVFKSSDIDKAVEEYADYNKMSKKIVYNTAGSNMTAGFRGARKVFSYLHKKDRKKIAVLITDGDPSVDYTPLEKPYTLYSDQDEIPGYDWEPYTQDVKCRYYKKADNGKFIFSGDAQSMYGDGLIKGYTNHKYSPKWRKIVKEGKTNIINENSVLKEAELLKKRTFNNKLYTINVKDKESSLLNKALFKDRYYNGTKAGIGDKVYEVIYNDLISNEKFTYKPVNIELYDKLSEFVELNENKNIIVNIGGNRIVLEAKPEADGNIKFISTEKNYGLGNIEIRYNKADKSFSWTIENGISKGETISLMYGVTVKENAKILGKGNDEDYTGNVPELIKTEEDTGTYAGKYAYPADEAENSFVSYGVKEFDKAGKEIGKLKGKNLKTLFPKSGVRPDEIKYKLTVIHKYGENNSEETATFAKGFVYSENKKEQDDWIFESATVDNQRYTGNLPITGVLEKDTEIVFIYKKKPVLSKKGKVVVRDIFKTDNSADINVDRLEEIIDIGEEREYTPLSEADLDNKKGVSGYPDDVEFYTAKSFVSKRIKAEKETEPNYADFEYILSKEVVKVYDHFNDEEVYRENADITIRKNSEIKNIPQPLTKDEIETKGKSGEWKVVEKNGSNYEIKSLPTGERAIHFYYLQKAEIIVKAHYTSVLGVVTDEELDKISDKYFGDKVTYTDNKTTSEYELIKVTVNGSDVNNTGKTILFDVKGQETVVDYYYTKRPEGRVFKEAAHIYLGYNADDTDFEAIDERSGKEGTDYVFVKKEIVGWKLKEIKIDDVVVTEATGHFGDTKKIEFFYEKDMVDIVVENIYLNEDDTEENRISQPVVKVQRGEKKDFTPKADIGYENWITTEDTKTVDTKPDFGTVNETIFKVSFTFKIKRVKITVKDRFENEKERSVSEVAIGSEFEISEKPENGWKLKEIIVGDKTGVFVNGKVTVKVDKDLEVIFIYEKIAKQESTPNPTPNPMPNPADPIPNPTEPTTPVVPTPNEQIPSNPHIVDIPTDSTPQGTADVVTTPDNDNTDETGIADLEDEDISDNKEEMEIDEDITPQGAVKTEDEVAVDDDVTPQGNTKLPGTGGVNTDVVGLFGITLVGLGLLFKRKTR